MRLILKNKHSYLLLQQSRYWKSYAIFVGMGKVFLLHRCFFCVSFRKRWQAWKIMVWYVSNWYVLTIRDESQTGINGVTLGFNGTETRRRSWNYVKWGSKIEPEALIYNSRLFADDVDERRWYVIIDCCATTKKCDSIFRLNSSPGKTSACNFYTSSTKCVDFLW